VLQLIPVARTRRRWLVPLLLGALLSAALAGPAAASSETLKRSVTNILFGPLDMALGPVVGTRAVYYNIQDIDDSPGVRAAYVVPGVVWNSMLQMSGGALRLFTGVLEFIPGLILLPFEADLDPMFAPVERGNALIDEQYDFLTVKIGVNYVD
jgi:hypothetical protein